MFNHMPIYARWWSALFFVMFFGYCIKLSFAGNSIGPMIYPAIALLVGYLPIYFRFYFPNGPIRVIVMTIISLTLFYLFSGPLESWATNFLSSQYESLTDTGQVGLIILGGIFDLFDGGQPPVNEEPH